MFDSLLPDRRALSTIALIAGGACLIAAVAPRGVTSGTIEQRLANLERRVGTSGALPPQLTGLNDVRAFGALGDNKQDDGPAIQRAIDIVYKSGGGTVYIPPGRYRVTGEGLQLRNRVSLSGVDSTSSQLIYDQSDPRQYLINLVNSTSEYAPTGQSISNLRLITSGGGAVRTSPLPWTDGLTRGWHTGSMSNVVVEGGARGAYAIHLPEYCQSVVMENVHLLNFYGPSVYINGNCNVLRNVSPDGFAAAGQFRNFQDLPMVSIDGDSNVFEQSVVEQFSGFPALQLKGYRHRVMQVWTESDGPGDAAGWIVLNDAHHILFDWPHLLVENRHKLKMIKSDATIIMMEPKHIPQSLDMDSISTLTVIVPAALSPGVHVVASEKR